MTSPYTDETTYFATRAPVHQASTLIPEAYTSPEFFALERERLFSTSWVAVGTTDQVARTGQLILADVAGRSVFVTRNEQGQLRAFHNVCRHRGTKLLSNVDSLGRGSKIRCPYHSWTYNLDGRCLGTPLFEGSDIPEAQRGAFDMTGVQGFTKADHGLLAVRVQTWGFLVFVCLDPRAAPLEDQLGDLPERLAGYRLASWRLMRRRRYDVAADYKLIAENFQEYYHLPWVHPELVKVSRLDDHYRWQGNGMYTGMCLTPISRNTTDGGWQGLPPLATLPAADAAAGRFVWLFPNTGLVVLPNHAFVILAHPAGSGHTVEEALLLTHPDAAASRDADRELDQLEHFWDLINRQDIDMVERVQQGISNPAYRGGRMCYRFEEPLHRFQNMVIDRMVGIHRIPGGDTEELTPLFGSAHD